ncbi:MAG: hypothetical protein FJ387_26290, partial [Verrucomicrobia bacterium]|nr:hypothetical protein [Verrucomicrobiota bacterium]
MHDRTWVAAMSAHGETVTVHPLVGEDHSAGSILTKNHVILYVSIRETVSISKFLGRDASGLLYVRNAVPAKCLCRIAAPDPFVGGGCEVTLKELGQLIVADVEIDVFGDIVGVVWIGQTRAIITDPLV